MFRVKKNWTVMWKILDLAKICLKYNYIKLHPYLYYGLTRQLAKGVTTYNTNMMPQNASFWGRGGNYILKDYHMHSNKGLRDNYCNKFSNLPSVCDLLRNIVLARGWSDGLNSMFKSGKKEHHKYHLWLSNGRHRFSHSF